MRVRHQTKFECKLERRVILDEFEKLLPRIMMSSLWRGSAQILGTNDIS